MKEHSGLATVVGFWPYFGQKLIAVYRFQDQIWLRVGSSRWNLDTDAIDITRHSDGEVCRAQICDQELVLFQREYRDPSTSWIARIDPDYDVEHEDFFLYLSRYACDAAWRSRVREGWQDGAQSG